MDPLPVFGALFGRASTVAIISWPISSSISLALWGRVTSAAWAISSAAPWGIIPNSSSARAKAASTRKRQRNLKSSSQMAFISFVPYLNSMG